MKKKMALMFLLKTLFVLSPFIFILYSVNLEITFTLIKKVHPLLIPILLLNIYVKYFIQSFRFQILLSTFGVKLKTFDVFKIDLKSRYFSTLIPSSFGQDLVKLTFLKKQASLKTILQITILFRTIGMIGLLFLSAFSLPFILDKYFDNFKYLLVLLFVLLFSTVLIIKSSKFSGLPRSRFLRKFLIYTIRLKNFIISNKTIFLYNLCLSIVVHMFSIIFASTVFFFLTNFWFFIDSFNAIPSIELISLFWPFTPNGAGIREYLLIVFFDAIELSKETLLLFISFGFLGHIANLSGIFVIFFEKIHFNNFKIHEK